MFLKFRRINYCSVTATAADEVLASRTILQLNRGFPRYRRSFREFPALSSSIHFFHAVGSIKYKAIEPGRPLRNGRQWANVREVEGSNALKQTQYQRASMRPAELERR